MNGRRRSAAVIALLASTLPASGCISVRYSEATAADVTVQARSAELGDRIAALDASVDRVEAERIARTAVRYPLQLANDYRLSRPPVLHNVLVNWGMKPRGLCTHWAEDLLRELVRLAPESVELHWGVARQGSRFPLEHSSVVVTALGQPFEDGIVLDGWRHSGWLYYGPVRGDKYPWKRLDNARSRAILGDLR